jgi:ATP-dependent DNA helicase DinG
MYRFFTDNALLQMRQAISETDSKEVFFVGRTDEARIVTEVEPLARGNRDAVAAIMVATAFGDVVIHNHPSGELTPSQPDIEIASLLGNQGVGFYIVDNEVSRCYQAVAPFAHTEAQLLSFPEIEHYYAQEGVFARTLPDHEYRAEQSRMAFAVTEAFNDGKVALIEAGTGTGKSLAYLLPAALWATRNRERVVVSTNTINLQEQLTRKDIPFLHDGASLDVKAVLVKGRGNYICLRKLRGLETEPSLFPDDNRDELGAIIAWSAITGDGCKSDLSFVPREDAWEEVCCEADQCGRITCPFYSRCFFYRARREAATADILVTNHALLMADVALRRDAAYAGTSILPPYTRLIIDEGHHLEETATSHLSSHLSRHGLLKQLGRLQNPRRPAKGLLPTLAMQLSRELPDSMDRLYLALSALLETRLMPERISLADQVNAVMDGIALSLLETADKGATPREAKLRITAELRAAPFWRELEPKLAELSRSIFSYAELMGELLAECRRLPDSIREKVSGTLTDLKGIRARLERESRGLLQIIGEGIEECRWIEARKGTRGTVVRLCLSPLDISGTVKEALLDRMKTVVVTSATLTVAASFDYLKNRTGLGRVGPERLTELLLLSPFDFAHQAFVGIPADLPPPGAPGFEECVANLLMRALAASQGRAFVLFTSHQTMQRLYGRLEEPLRALSLDVMRQGTTSRHQLLARFRQAEHPVLFGTDSFWEGVDVKGDTLQLVVMARLPFRVPTDPVIEARTEQIAARGGDPFMEYTVPEAVIRFKQGFGRLIRSRDDRGCVLILDSRVLTKPYGRRFLSSLPPARQVAGDSNEVLREMEKFFGVPEQDSLRKTSH